MPEELWRIGAEHPVIAAGLTFMFVVILLLGTLHTFKLFLRMLVVLADEVKHELAGILLWIQRLKEALSTWKSDP